MIASYLDMRGKRGPLGFIASFILIALACILAVQGIYAWLHSNHHLSGIIIFLGILVAIVGVSIALTQTIRRLNDLQWCGMYSMLIIFPSAAVGLIALLGLNLGAWWAVVVVGVLVFLPLCLPGKQ